MERTSKIERTWYTKQNWRVDRYSTSHQYRSARLETITARLEEEQTSNRWMHKCKGNSQGMNNELLTTNIRKHAATRNNVVESRHYTVTEQTWKGRKMAAKEAKYLRICRQRPLESLPCGRIWRFLSHSCGRHSLHGSICETFTPTFFCTFVLKWQTKLTVPQHGGCKKAKLKSGRSCFLISSSELFRSHVNSLVNTNF